MNIKAALLFFTIVVMGLSSCKKNGDYVVIDKTARLYIINASSDTLNFYQNGTRLNNNSNLYPFGSLSYLNVTAGTQNFQFKKAGNPNALVDVPNTLQTDSAYTMVMAGELADNVFLVKDSFIATTDSTASIRFVNASPGAGSLDITIGSTFNYKNRVFKSVTPYTKIKAGKNILTVYQAGSTTPLIKPGTVTLTAHTTYTLFTKGALNGTGSNVFGARIVTTRSN